ncbi:hypothetical protein DN820_05000 [Stutzerimonas nosocomialis]|uniref:Translation initiation factor 2 n=1 Tax=Stutzerimonas nosocomialis TaxID=1056496 RepID=A0A5R9R2W2_9GAMM|nr:hypothetical protein [Stutzerimonas nosocomialis]TLX64785.1 hypothetical protein DN820_05000 [Stutzerimonas nosocomialis]
MKPWIVFLLLASTLVGCDDGNKPMPRDAVSDAASQPPAGRASEPVEAESETQPAPSAPADPAGETAPTSMPPAIEIESPSLPDLQADKPPAVVINLPPPNEADAPVVAAKPARAVKQAVKEVELATPPLDLSLPEDWVEEFALVEEITDSGRVLPSLFAEPRRQVQMSARLLSGSTYEDSDRFDGAEIQFEIRR